MGMLGRIGVRWWRRMGCEVEGVGMGKAKDGNAGDEDGRHVREAMYV